MSRVLTARKHDATSEDQGEDGQHTHSRCNDWVPPHSSAASEQGIGRHIGQEQD